MATASLLVGAEPLAGSASRLQSAADAMGVRTAGPAGEGLAGESAALAEPATGRVSVPASRSRPGRHPLLTSLLSAKAAAAAIAAVSLGGGAAAYAGVLPAPAQQFAHDMIGAPAAGSKPTGTHPGATATPVGPDATGPAAFGLCTAYAHAKAHGTSQQQSVAFRNLQVAAGGPANVAAYCATVAHPGNSPHPSGQPSAHLSGQPSAHPSGQPTSHPSGPPVSQPTPHATGQPSSHP